MKKSLIIVLASSLITFSGKAKSPDTQSAVDGYHWLSEANGDLTAVILHDIFSPPIASRIYAYSNLAAYEGIRLAHSEYLSVASQLKGLDSLPVPDKSKRYDFHVAGLRAFYLTGKTFVFSEADVEERWGEVLQKIKGTGISDTVLKNSIQFGEKIAGRIIQWAKKDNYIQTRTFPRYKYKGQVANWLPTPPDYAEGLEPYWSKIRPFSLDSASQFMPQRPIPYDTASGSAFMKALMDVYNTSLLEKGAFDTARYWDDNPFATVYQGHFSFAIKKVTPGGHWIGITSIVLEQTNSDLMRSAESYLLVSTAIFDGFISCWDEKYRSEYIRPVTAINRLVDERWKPFIQTPPFPEYTSGHSVISGSASEVLTSLFGDNFRFTDTLEVLNELPKQTFSSFRKAAAQASNSRYYGGIHFKPTLDISLDQGRRLGKYVTTKIRTRLSQKGY
ncbi:MAG: hypothetical protein RL021_757 [Bacteroidota bacterium]